MSWVIEQLLGRVSGIKLAQPPLNRSNRRTRRTRLTNRYPTIRLLFSFELLTTHQLCARTGGSSKDTLTVATRNLQLPMEAAFQTREADGVCS
jgi:hypothetical protein